MEILNLFVAAWEFIKDILTVLSPIAPHFNAVFPALLISGLGTQMLKWPWRYYKRRLPATPPEETERRAIQFVAVSIAFMFMYPVWPGGGITAFAWCVALSLLSPVLYRIFPALLYQRYPKLEALLSSKPS